MSEGITKDQLTGPRDSDKVQQSQCMNPPTRLQKDAGVTANNHQSQCMNPPTRLQKDAGVTANNRQSQCMNLLIRLQKYDEDTANNHQSQCMNPPTRLHKDAEGTANNHQSHCFIPQFDSQHTHNNDDDGCDAHNVIPTQTPSHHIPFDCYWCKKSFDTFSGLRKHLSVDHKGHDGFPCAMCGKNYARIAYLKDHIICHSDETHLKCSICGKVSSQSDNLLKHYRTVHGINKSTRTSTTVSNKKPLEDEHSPQHAGSVNDDDLQDLVPPTLSQDSIDDDDNNVYDSPLSYRFPILVSIQGNMEMLPASKMTLVGTGIFNCHVNLCSGKKDFECSMCKMEFDQFSDLQNHVSVHVSKDGFTCSLCDKTFAKNEDFRHHVVSHADETLFQCSISGKTFSHPDNLATHQRVLSSLHGCTPITKEKPPEDQNSDQPADNVNPSQDLVSPAQQHVDGNDKKSNHSPLSYIFPIMVGSQGNMEILPIWKSQGCSSGDIASAEGGTRRVRAALKGIGVFNCFANLQTGERSLECSVCKKTYHQFTDLKNHVLDHTSQNGFTCSICGRTFNENKYLRLHIASHADGTLMKCSICGKVFSNPEELKEHKKNLSGCSTSSNEKSARCKKALSESNTSSSKKSARPKKALSESSTSSNKKSARPKKALGGSSTASNEKSARPKKALGGSSTASNEKSSEDQAGDAFSHSAQMRPIKSPEKYPPCGICGKIFKTASYTRMHQLTHTRTMPDEKTCQCVVCGKAFSRKSNLVTHMRIHTGERPYKCPICGKCFTQRCTIAPHMRIHTGERRFLCTVCGKSFFNNYSLTLHFRIHTGERPYSCSTCGKRFKGPTCYKNHLQIHIGIGKKQHKCSICGKAYSSRQNLRLHSKVHTDSLATA